MNEKVRSRVQAAEMGFSRRISRLTLLGKFKCADIRESLNIESLLLRLERSHLRWYGRTCDTKVPGKNNQKTALFNTDWSKAYWPSQNSMARLRRRSFLVSPWHPSRASVLCCRRSRCLETPTRAAAPATPQGYTGLEHE